MVGSSMAIVMPDGKQALIGPTLVATALSLAGPNPTLQQLNDAGVAAYTDAARRSPNSTAGQVYAISRVARKGEARKGYRDTPGWEHVVTKVEALHQRGLSTTGIADQLNAEGIRTMNGGPWKRGTIHGILRGAA